MTVPSGETSWSTDARPPAATSPARAEAAAAARPPSVRTSPVTPADALGSAPRDGALGAAFPVAAGSAASWVCSAGWARRPDVFASSRSAGAGRACRGAGLFSRGGRLLAISSLLVGLARAPDGPVHRLVMPARRP
ncbi:MAG: hypothetical protein D6683_14220 [Actinomyces sp.]|nr:MAG: hypothetical protein D6683_14220 [Actinomyces sp.]